MKLTLVPPLAILLLSLKPAHDPICTGCDDSSTDPTTTSVGLADSSAISYGTVTPDDGICLPDGAGGCESTGCSPLLVITTDSFAGGAGRIDGVIGNVRMGPLKFPTGQNSTAYRGVTSVRCGESSPYYFDIAVQCGLSVCLELVLGDFECSGCVAE